jgi:predicted DNA binding protein
VKYAFTNGYYDQPRKINMSEIADEFNVSTQAVSDRLRRASKKLAKGFVN